MTLEHSSAPVTISVITVNYKVADFVPSLLASLPAATAGLAYETIIVDNASGQDDLAALYRDCQGARIVPSEVNLGFARGNNLGRAQASGEYLALVNPDVVLEPRSLRRLVEFLEAHPRAAMVGPRIVLPDGVTQSKPGRAPSWLDLMRALPLGARLEAAIEGATGRAAPEKPVACGFIHGSCMLIRASAFDAIAGLPTTTFMYGEEYLLGHRLALAGYEIWYDPTTAVLHADDASANRKWSSHEKALRKRRAHVIARAEILSRSQYLAWNIIMAAKEAAHSAKKRGNETSLRHADFARLHWSAISSVPADSESNRPGGLTGGDVSSAHES
jgi:N-acetylglucosaminyl-diphospho-decaprenol L-rhamnosyltransferase